MTHYVLRAYCFGYNDEVFYVCGTRISEIFEQRKKAEAAYRKAQVDYLRDIDLGEHEKFFDGDDAYIRKMDEFIHAKIGKHIVDDSGYVDIGTGIHTELSDDDLFEFGETGELHAYKLIAFDNEPVFHVLWNPEREQYFHTIDEGFEGLVYGTSRDELMKLIEGHNVCLDWSEWERSGTPEELSDNPTLLRKLIDTTDEFEFDAEADVVRFEDPATEQVIALSALLKKPIFEVRELSAEEVRDIEQDVGAGYDGGQGSFSGGCGLSVLKFLAWIFVPLVLIAGVRCAFGACDSFLAAVTGTASFIIKWTALIVVSLAIVLYVQFKLGSAANRKRE